METINQRFTAQRMILQGMGNFPSDETRSVIDGSSGASPTPTQRLVRGREGERREWLPQAP